MDFRYENLDWLREMAAQSFRQLRAEREPGPSDHCLEILSPHLDRMLSARDDTLIDRPQQHAAQPEATTMASVASKTAPKHSEAACEPLENESDMIIEAAIAAVKRRFPNFSHYDIPRALFDDYAYNMRIIDKAWPLPIRAALHALGFPLPFIPRFMEELDGEPARARHYVALLADRTPDRFAEAFRWVCLARAKYWETKWTHKKSGSSGRNKKGMTREKVEVREGEETEETNEAWDEWQSDRCRRMMRPTIGGRCSSSDVKMAVMMMDADDIEQEWAAIRKENQEREPQRSREWVEEMTVNTEKSIETLIEKLEKDLKEGGENTPQGYRKKPQDDEKKKKKERERKKRQRAKKKEKQTTAEEIKQGSDAIDESKAEVTNKGDHKVESSTAATSSVLKDVPSGTQKGETSTDATSSVFDDILTGTQLTSCCGKRGKSLSPATGKQPQSAPPAQAPKGTSASTGQSKGDENAAASTQHNAGASKGKGEAQGGWSTERVIAALKELHKDSGDMRKNRDLYDPSMYDDSIPDVETFDLEFTAAAAKASKEKGKAKANNSVSMDDIMAAAQELGDPSLTDGPTPFNLDSWIDKLLKSQNLERRIPPLNLGGHRNEILLGHGARYVMEKPRHYFQHFYNMRTAKQLFYDITITYMSPEAMWRTYMAKCQEDGKEPLTKDEWTDKESDYVEAALLTNSNGKRPCYPKWWGEVCDCIDEVYGSWREVWEMEMRRTWGELADAMATELYERTGGA